MASGRTRGARARSWSRESGAGRAQNNLARALGVPELDGKTAVGFDGANEFRVGGETGGGEIEHGGVVEFAVR